MNVVNLFERDVTRPLAGRHPTAPLGRWIVDEFRAGRRLVVRDVRADERYEPTQRAVNEALHVIGSVGVPLVKDGALVAVLVVQTAAPQDWQEHEIALVEETAQRIWAAVEWAKAQAALRASEERQVFLLTLSDALRPLADPAAVKAAAARVLGERLGANRAFYADVEGDDWLVVKGYEQGVAPLPDGPYAADTYGHWIMDLYRGGGRVVFRDAQTDPRFAAGERAAHAAVGITAAVGVPLVKEGRLVAILAVHAARPRDWTDDEIGLVEETAERTWAAV